jgi:hypothetical protein
MLTEEARVSNKDSDKSPKSIVESMGRAEKGI